MPAGAVTPQECDAAPRCPDRAQDHAVFVTAGRRYDGSFGYLHARLRCRLGQRSSLALGYQLTSVDVSREPGNGRRQVFDGELHGPTLQLTWAF